MKTFMFLLKIKNANKDFGLGPGILAIQEASYDIEEKDLKNPMFLKSLIEFKDEFISSHIEVEVLEK